MSETLREAPARKGIGWLLAGILLLAAKGKSLLFLFKALPAGKLLLTSGSMIAMIAFEAQRSGWWFGVGFVFLILIHELGHGYAMKQRGVASGWPIFIPFLGAMIAMKGAPQDRDAEAAIAYGGPLAGTGASLAAAGIGLQTDSSAMLALAYSGFFLNLFNLTPLSPLDGGRIAQAFSKQAWKVGLGILAVVFFLTGAPQLLLIGALALPQLFGSSSRDERELLTPDMQRFWAVRYFGLAAFLAAGIYFTGQLLHRT
jgi:Zn-dependent protease